MRPSIIRAKFLPTSRKHRYSGEVKESPVETLFCLGTLVCSSVSPPASLHLLCDLGQVIESFSFEKWVLCIKHLEQYLAKSKSSINASSQYLFLSPTRWDFFLTEELLRLDDVCLKIKEQHILYIIMSLNSHSNSGIGLIIYSHFTEGKKWCCDILNS